MKRDLGHEPTRQEIIEAGIIPLDKIDTAMAAAQVWSPIRLNHNDSPIIINPKIDQSLSYTDSEIDSVSSRIDMRAAVQKILEPDEIKVTFLYFFEELSQKEIAQSMDTYQMHVSRLLHKATDKLCQEFMEENQKVS